MSAEVSCGLGVPEGAGKVDTTEANGRPHGFETAGGEAIETTVLDPGDEAWPRSLAIRREVRWVRRLVSAASLAAAG